MQRKDDGDRMRKSTSVHVWQSSRLSSQVGPHGNKLRSVENDQYTTAPSTGGEKSFHSVIRSLLISTRNSESEDSFAIGHVSPTDPMPSGLYHCRCEGLYFAVLKELEKYGKADWMKPCCVHAESCLYHRWVFVVLGAAYARD